MPVRLGSGSFGLRERDFLIVGVAAVVGKTEFGARVSLCGRKHAGEAAGELHLAIRWSFSAKSEGVFGGAEVSPPNKDRRNGRCRAVLGAGPGQTL